MTTDSTRQNPTTEVEPSDVTELSEEAIEELSGGYPGEADDERLMRRWLDRKEQEEPKDGGVTGSW